MESFHEQGLVHGDLRDANFICTYESVTGVVHRDSHARSHDLKITKEDNQRVFSFTRATHSSVMAPSASCTSSPLSRWVYSLMILEFRLVGGLELRNNETIAIGLLRHESLDTAYPSCKMLQLQEYI